MKVFQLLFNSLSARVTLIIALAFILSQIGMFQKILSKKKFDSLDKLILSIVFGGIGIIGTFVGLEVNDAIVNSRVIGIFVGGLLGGPVVGIASGILAGSHRYLIDIGGFSALACGISTIIEGILAGYFKKRFDNSKHKVLFAFIGGIVAEIIQMIIILIVAKPYNEALELVKIIGMPMIIANALGIAAFIFIVDSFMKEVEKEAAYQAHSALKIADKTLQYFRLGYNRETAEKVANIIKENLAIDAVALTDREKILAHVGIGRDHHIYGMSIQTQISRDVIEKGNYKISNNKKEIRCNEKKCPLQSAIIVPLREGYKVIGTLKLYKSTKNGITEVEKEIAIGLTKIFSTQIELSKLDIQKELLTKSELQMLQAQINPHFLFNAINTISSLIRIEPDKARNLLIHLGNYFRNNLNSNFQDISLKKEINNVNSYMEIEKARFGDKLEIIYDIPDDIECSLPPLIIQPLAENAVKHGIVTRIKGGTVKIKARKDNDNNNTIITVEDDGVGIEEEFINYILSDNTTEDRIGIKNVNNRLINKYGEKYALKIDSKIDVGTKVIVVIPD